MRSGTCSGLVDESVVDKLCEARRRFKNKVVLRLGNMRMVPYMGVIDVFVAHGKGQRVIRTP